MPILGVIASSRLTTVPSDYEYIDGTTLSSTSQNVTFSSLTTSYTHLQIRISGRTIGSDNGLGLRFNGDTSSGNYSWQRGYSGSSDGSSDSYQGQLPRSSVESASLYGPVLIDIPNYRVTNQWKVSRCWTGYRANEEAAFLIWQTWNNTAAITSLTITTQTLGGTSTLAAGTMISIYGMK